MANLDRFSRPIHDENHFEDPKPVCQCGACGDDLFEGWHYKAGGQYYCDKDCFIQWAIEEHEGKSEILMEDE